LSKFLVSGRAKHGSQKAVSDRGIVGSWDRGIVGPWDRGTVGLKDRGIEELSGRGIELKAREVERRLVRSLGFAARRGSVMPERF
jgi:hypothetical protein